MAVRDNSIFRERAIEKYMRRREIHVVLRLVSPPMFFFLWVLLFLAVCGGVVVGLIQVPELVQGKGAVIQQKVNNKQNTQEIVVLLLLPPDQQKNLKVGQPVTISITGTNISFTSTIAKMQPQVMSPADIRAQYSLPAALSQALASPSIVASAPVQPASLAHTYLGSQCGAQVKIGAQSALSLIPIVSNFPDYIDQSRQILNSIYKDFQ